MAKHTHCVKGHELIPENRVGRLSDNCRLCRNARSRITKKAWRAKNRDKYIEMSRANSRKAKGLYHSLRGAAKGRAYTVELTFEQFWVIRKNASCHYCGGVLPEAGSGIDRKDSTVGYTFDNCVPCCRLCNVTKGYHISYDEMMMLVRYRKGQQ